MKRFLTIFILLATITAAFALCGCQGDVELQKQISNLNDEDPEDREDAAKAIENMGLRGAAAVDQLAKCLNDDEEKVRYRAAKALAKLGRGIAKRFRSTWTRVRERPE